MASVQEALIRLGGTPSAIFAIFTSLYMEVIIVTREELINKGKKHHKVIELYKQDDIPNIEKISEQCELPIDLCKMILRTYITAGYVCEAKPGQERLAFALADYTISKLGLTD